MQIPNVIFMKKNGNFFLWLWNVMFPLDYLLWAHFYPEIMNILHE